MVFGASELRGGLRGMQKWSWLTQSTLANAMEQEAGDLKAVRSGSCQISADASLRSRPRRSTSPPPLHFKPFSSLHITAADPANHFLHTQNKSGAANQHAGQLVFVSDTQVPNQPQPTPSHPPRTPSKTHPASQPPPPLLDSTPGHAPALPAASPQRR